MIDGKKILYPIRMAQNLKKIEQLHTGLKKRAQALGFQLDQIIAELSIRCRPSQFQEASYG